MNDSGEKINGETEDSWYLITFCFIFWISACKCEKFSLISKINKHKSNVLTEVSISSENNSCRYKKITNQKIL